MPACRKLAKRCKLARRKRDGGVQRIFCFLRLTFWDLVDGELAEVDLLRVGAQGDLCVAKEVFPNLRLAMALQVFVVTVDASSRSV